MQHLHLVGFTAELDGLIFSARRGSKAGGYVVSLDDRLLDSIREAARLKAGGDLDLTSDDGSAAGEASAVVPDLRPVRSALAPKEIQARLRAGRSVAEVAAEGEVDESWILRFASPVLAEQARVVERALEVHCHAARKGESALTLGESVERNIVDRGGPLTADELSGGWSAYHLRDGAWIVRFRFPSKRRAQTAQWAFDLADLSLVPMNRLATELGYVDPSSQRRRRPSDAATANGDDSSDAGALRTARRASGGATRTGRTTKASTARKSGPPTRRAPAGGTKGTARSAKATTTRAVKAPTRAVRASARPAKASKVPARTMKPSARPAKAPARAPKVTRAAAPAAKAPARAPKVTRAAAPAAKAPSRTSKVAKAPRAAAKAPTSRTKIPTPTPTPQVAKTRARTAKLSSRPAKPPARVVKATRISKGRATADALPAEVRSLAPVAAVDDVFSGTADTAATISVDGSPMLVKGRAGAGPQGGDATRETPVLEMDPGAPPTPTDVDVPAPVLGGMHRNGNSRPPAEVDAEAPKRRPAVSALTPQPLVDERRVRPLVAVRSRPTPPLRSRVVRAPTAAPQGRVQAPAPGLAPGLQDEPPAGAEGVQADRAGPTTPER